MNWSLSKYPNIQKSFWATFVSEFEAKKFQKSPNQVTLHICSHFSEIPTKPRRRCWAFRGRAEETSRRAQSQSSRTRTESSLDEASSALTRLEIELQILVISARFCRRRKPSIERTDRRVRDECHDLSSKVLWRNFGANFGDEESRFHFKLKRFNDAFKIIG